MAPVGLRLLGGFALLLDARPRALPVRKAQALLAYLALRAGRAHPRETLTALLWSETGDKQARQSLRQTMFRLRRALSGRGRVAFVTHGDTVALDPAAVDVDVARFERLVRRGTPEALEAAVALYHGPLLNGLHVAEPSFEDWLASERARLQELAVEALRQLVGRHMKGGRLDQATQAAARLVALDPLQEDAHRMLMRLYARQGRRAAALRQYQACVAALQKELGVEPEPETKRLYLETLQRATAPGRREGRHRVGAATGRALLPASDAPLVGRATELARLRQRLHAACRGRGQTVLLTGEAGIGKSRLMEELAAAAATRGVRVLLGRSYETEQIIPFQPWVEALRAEASTIPLDDAGGEGTRGRTELARLFPELATPDTRPAITSEGHLRLFESIVALIHEVARRQPLLLVLEDLQWADEMSLRLLPFVARRLGERPVLVVGVAREEELAEAPVFRRLVSELAALLNVEHVDLGGLSETATAALVRALARAGSPQERLAEITAKVWALSEGNPFVIVETMRALGDGRPPDAAGVELPQRVRAMIAARLERLSPHAQQLALVASVFTREFEFPVLQRAGGLTRRETAEAVEELVRRRILDAIGDRFDFTHARIRQAVYAALIAPRRQALHGAIGEAVEAVYAGRLDEWYDRLAYHFSRADEPAKALTYLVHLADKTTYGYALEDAVRILRDALPYADHLPPAEGDRRRLEVVYRLADVLGLLGRPAEARNLLLAQEPVITRLREPALAGRYHFWVAQTYGNLGDSERGLQHAKRALEEAARAGDEITMGQACYTLARDSYMTARPLEGIAHARQAVALLEKNNRRRRLAWALLTLAWNLHHVGDFAAALDALARMREIGESLDDLRLQAAAAVQAGWTHTVMGELDAAAIACHRCVDLAPDPIARALGLGWLGAVHWDQGDPVRAISLLEDAIARLQHLSGTGGYRRFDGWLMAVLAESYAMKGETERALEVAASALTAATAAGFLVAVGYAERATGKVLLASGKLDDAEAVLRRALATFEAIEARPEAARSRLALAEILATRGDRSAAATELAAAREAFVQMGAPRLVERADALRAAVGLPDAAPN